MVCKLRDSLPGTVTPEEISTSSAKKYLAIEGNKVLGCFDSLDLANKCLEDEKQKDFFWLVLHRAIIKKFLKNKIYLPEKMYYIAEVIDT